MKIGFQRTAHHPFWRLDNRFSVEAELLRNDLNDLFSRVHIQVVHAVDEGLDLFLADLRFIFLADSTAMMLQALDVLACNSDIHIPDIDTRFL